MSNPSIITVDGVSVRIRGKVEFESGMLSVPNNRGALRLERLLEPAVENGPSNHVVFFRDEQLPPVFVLQVRAPKKPPAEG